MDLDHERHSRQTMCFSSKHGQHVSAQKVQFENRRTRSGGVVLFPGQPQDFLHRTPRRQERAEVNTIHINTAISACRRDRGWEVPLTFLHQTLGSPAPVALDLGVSFWVLFHSSKLMMYLDDVSIKVKFNPAFFGSQIPKTLRRRGQGGLGWLRLNQSQIIIDIPTVQFLFPTYITLTLRP